MEFVERARPDERVQAPAPSRAAESAIVAFAGLSFLALILLHFVEPQLHLTWSFSHLSRRPWLPWLGSSLVVVLPFLVRAAWRLPAAGRELSPLSCNRFALCWLAGLSLLLGIGALFPAPSTSLDAGLFLGWVSHGGDVARWHLLLRSYRLVVEATAGLVEPVVVVRAINAVMASIALGALVATARLLARTRGEAVALTLLSISALGVLQLCIGYADVYPLPLAAIAVYVLVSLAAATGRVHPFWPLVLVAVGPFFYLGLVLLAPSVIVVVICVWRQPGGPSKLAAGGALAAVIGGAATLPRFGSFFAWRAFLAAIDDLPATSMGANPSGYSLPLEQVMTSARLEEVAHLLLLVDPVGWVLILGTAGLAFSRWGSDKGPALPLLIFLVAPYVAFMFWMEPLYGAYGDWDLFSYGAVPTALLGGYAFVLFGRAAPSRFPLLLGLALACASVHLLARLNALDVDAERHLHESPSHIAHDRRGG